MYVAFYSSHPGTEREFFKDISSLDLRRGILDVLQPHQLFRELLGVGLIIHKQQAIRVHSNTVPSSKEYTGSERGLVGRRDLNKILR